MTVKTLLAFHFDKEVFAEKANYIHSENAPALIEFKKIVKEITIKYKTIGELSIANSEEVVRLFWENVSREAKALKTVFSSRSLISGLAYSMGFQHENYPASIIKSDYAGLALDIFRSHWKTRYFRPLIALLLKEWDEMPTETLADLRQLCIAKLAKDPSKRAILRHFRKRPELLQSFGPAYLAKALVYKNFPPKTSLQVLSLDEYAVNWRYLQTFIVCYTQEVISQPQQNLHLVKTIVHFLDHQRKQIPIGKIASVKQSIILLVNAFKPGYSTDFDRNLHHAAYNLVGDPNDDIAWGLWAKASEEEKQARTILNNQVSHLFLQAFFKTIAGRADQGRLQFWDKYSKDFAFVKVFCSKEVKDQLLKEHPDMKTFAESRIGFLKAASSRSLAAFCMEVNNYVLVEFSQSGYAFYAYKRTNAICPDIHKEEIERFNLIQPRKVSVIREHNWHSKDEGKVIHHIQWEDILNKWLALWVNI